MELKGEDDAIAAGSGIGTRWCTINAERTIAEVSAEIQSVLGQYSVVSVRFRCICF